MTDQATQALGAFPVSDLPPNAVLTMEQFGKATNVGYDAIARGVRRGEIPAHKISGAIRIFWGEAIQKTSTMAAWKRGRS